MKVTKSILREMIEAEMLNEKIGASGHNDRGDVRRLNQALVDRNLRKFSRLVRNEFQNLTQEDWDEHPDLLRIFTTANGIEGWEGSGAAEVLDSAADDDFVSDALVNQTQSASDATLDALDPGRRPDPDTDTSAGETEVAQEPALSDRQSLERLLTGRSVIRSGQRGDSVRALQRILITRLNQNGLESVATAIGEPDGDFGPKTKDAVEALQRKYDIDVDGVVGRQTASAILANSHVETQATRTAPVRRRQAPSAGDEPAAQETYASLDPFGNGIGIWNPDAKVWFATNWARASTESKEAGYNTAIKLENEDGVRYVRKAGDALTEDDINELLDDDGAPTEADANQTGVDSVMIPANEAVNYFKRFTRDLNEIDSMRDDRSFTDIMASEEAEAEEAEEVAPEAEETESGESLEALLQEFSESSGVSIEQLEIVMSNDSSKISAAKVRVGREFKSALEDLLNEDHNNMWYGGELRPETVQWLSALFFTGPGREPFWTTKTSEELIEFFNERVNYLVNNFSNEVQVDNLSQNMWDGESNEESLQNLKSDFKDFITDTEFRLFEFGDIGNLMGKTGTHEDAVKWFNFLQQVIDIKKNQPETDSEAEVQSESLSYDRFSKLAGILLD